MRYAELLDRIEKPVIEPVDGDEIVDNIMSKYGLRFRDDDTV